MGGELCIEDQKDKGEVKVDVKIKDQRQLTSNASIRMRTKK